MSESLINVELLLRMRRTPTVFCKTVLLGALPQPGNGIMLNEGEGSCCYHAEKVFVNEGGGASVELTPEEDNADNREWLSSHGWVAT